MPLLGSRSGRRDEHLILSNRNILADQMAFLKAQLPKKTRLFG